MSMRIQLPENLPQRKQERGGGECANSVRCNALSDVHHIIDHMRQTSPLRSGCNDHHMVTSTQQSLGSATTHTRGGESKLERLHSGGGLQNHRGKPHLHGFWRPPGRYRVGGSPRGGRTVHSIPRVRRVKDPVYLRGLPTRALQLALLTVKYNTRNGQAYKFMEIVVSKQTNKNK